MVGYVEKPAWLESLLTESFFVPCLGHETAKKNEKNIFCLDCCRSICPHCLSVHRSHRLLQIRRYVYHDVIRLDDMEKLIDCSHVQPYTTNSAKVVFLNQRPQSRPFKGSGNICCTCERSLQEPYHFCSLGCKVDHIINQGRDLSKYLYECHYLVLSDFVFAKEYEDGQMTPNSTLDNSLALRTSSGSSGSEEEVGCKRVSYTEFVKKKRSVFKSSAATTNIETGSESSFNRRKGTPHRSPFF